MSYPKNSTEIQFLSPELFITKVREYSISSYSEFSILLMILLKTSEPL